MAIGCILNIGGSTESTPTYYDLIDTVTTDWTSSGCDSFSVTKGSKISFLYTRYSAATTCNFTYTHYLRIKSNNALLNFSGTRRNTFNATTKIMISDDGGSNWTQIGSSSTPNPAFNLSLASYKGKDVLIRVIYQLDQTNVTEGLNITVFNIQA